MSLPQGGGKLKLGQGIASSVAIEGFREMLGTIGTILSVLGGINTVMDAYKNVGVLVNGDGTERILDAIRESREELVQLKENIYFAPQWRAVSDTAHPSRALSSLRSVCQVLEPVQHAVGGKIVSSRLIETPDKMMAELKKNPWDVLHNITPFELTSQPTNPAMAPIMFVHDGRYYIGWQMRGVLPVLFNCEWHELPNLRNETLGSARKLKPSLESGDPPRKANKEEILLTQCIILFYREWVADEMLFNSCDRKVPGLNEFLQPPRPVFIRIHRRVSGVEDEEPVDASEELRRCMEKLYQRYTVGVSEYLRDGDSYVCVLPLLGGERHPASRALVEAVNNLHKVVPGAKPLPISVCFDNRRREVPLAGVPQGATILRETGTVVSFDSSEGVGFISPDQGGKNIIVYHASIEDDYILEEFGTLDEGMRVTFQREADTRGRPPRAVRIRWAG